MACDLNYFLNGIRRLYQKVQDVRTKQRTSRRILKNIEAQKEVDNYLREKYVTPYLMDAKPDISTQQEKDKIVWQYWDAGLENAPKIVKASVSSVRRNLPSGYKHIVLSDETIHKFVQIPEWVALKRKNNSAFRTTFFSDVLRLFLLEKYGGVWIDATILMTSEIPSKILDKTFFCFYRGLEPPESWVYEKFNPAYFSWRPEFKVRLCNSFLISNELHPFVVALKDILLKYWGNESEIRHYFILQIMFQQLINAYPYSCVEWDHEDDLKIHRMLFSVKEPFSQAKWDEICSSCYVHKLTYYKDAGKDSFYSYIEQLGS